MGGGGLPGAAGGRYHARPASAITGVDGRYRPYIRVAAE